MKTFITLLLFYSSLLSSTPSLIKQITIYHDKEQSYTLETIQSQRTHFYKASEDNISTDTTTWLHITLDDRLKSGHYILSYNFADFDLISMTPPQKMHKFNLYGTKRISFEYDTTRDKSDYFIRILPTNIPYPPFIRLQTEDDFYTSINTLTLYLLLSGVVLGIILMAAIYNGALYYYNKEPAFAYYTLMQLCMLAVLSFHTGMPHVQFPSLLTHPFVYEYLSLFTALFAIFFARSFLDTKANLPYHDKILLLFISLIMIDILYYPKPLIAEYGLYSITTAFFVYVGYKRMRQGYKPARYYFWGWLALVLGIIILEHFGQYAYFDPMLVGSTIEAIMLAFALSYKMHQINKDKEIQQAISIQQNKLASMGEMLGNIAHQWRQPLTNLSYIFMNIETMDDKQERQEKIEEGTRQLEYMSQSIEDFMHFYTPSKERETFEIKETIQSVIELLHQEAIMIEIKGDKREIYNYKSSFKQLILNLLTNAKEALIHNEIQNPRITIMIEDDTIHISDNAGGIKTHPIEKIFEPYFSTKEGSTGIGLYMSKALVSEHLGGDLSVKNSTKGAVFILQLHTE